MASSIPKGAITTERASRSDLPRSELDSGRACTLTVAHCPLEERRGAQVEVRANADDLLIGRDVPRGLTLEDVRASRLHARIVWDPTLRAFRVGDADSSNGTLVNGARVRSARLSHGDVIRCGDSVLIFETEAPMKAVYERARHFAGTKLTVLVSGETGTGKEVVSRFVHDESGVAGDMVAVNCATLSRELAPAEFFGHVRGAFSGATQSRGGLFVAADRGTLLLDEIGDLPLDVQPAILRALEEGVVRSVGSDCGRPVSVRVIAATHLDLDELAQRGLFRRDLLGRISQVRLQVPPLRERRSEILPLLGALAKARGIELQLTAEAAETLLLWSYPYNVRELKSLVLTLGSRAVARVDQATLRDVDPRLERQSEPGCAAVSNDDARKGFDRRQQIIRELERYRGNVSKVAHALGSDRAQIYRWMKSLGVSVASYRR